MLLLQPQSLYHKRSTTPRLCVTLTAATKIQFTTSTTETHTARIIQALCIIDNMTHTLIFTSGTQHDRQFMAMITSWHILYMDYMLEGRATLNM